MASFWRGVNRGLSGFVPERRIFVQSGHSTSYVRLTPIAQLLTGGAVIAAAGWMTIATAVVVLDRVTAGSGVSGSPALQEAVDARLDEIAAERDQRAAEARSAQARFRIAMDQISRQQTTILESVEERRELATALDLMRSRLHEAVVQRDEASEANDALLAQMTEVNDTLIRNQGSGADLAQTLDTISAALADAAVARDRAKADRSELEAELAELEMRVAVNSQLQDEMVEQLEQAVAMSLGPLEKMLERSNVDVDSVISSVRRAHSGAGGPLSPVSVSSRSFDNPELTSRFDDVMSELDRLNLTRIAASKIPYGMPVLSSHRFTSGFGYRRDPKGFGRRMHSGVDFAAGRGTPIYATADGVVKSAASEGGYGRTVRITHEFGFETVYAHQTRLLVSPGQRVSRGDKIGEMGSTGRSTGVHLHYEVRLDGRPVNPMTYLDAAREVY